MLISRSWGTSWVLVFLLQSEPDMQDRKGGGDSFTHVHAVCMHANADAHRRHKRAGVLDAPPWLTDWLTGKVT